MYVLLASARPAGWLLALEWKLVFYDFYVLQLISLLLSLGLHVFFETRCSMSDF